MIGDLLQSEGESGGNTMAPTEFNFVLASSIFELISSTDDRKDEPSCRKVLIGHDAGDRDLAPVEQHNPQDTEICTAMGRTDVRRITKWARSGTDRAVPSGQFAVLLVAEIVAEEVSVPYSVRGARFRDESP